MPRPRIAMRKVRDILRLAWGEGLSHREGREFLDPSGHSSDRTDSWLSWATAGGDERVACCSPLT